MAIGTFVLRLGLHGHRARDDARRRPVAIARMASLRRVGDFAETTEIAGDIHHAVTRNTPFLAQEFSQQTSFPIGANLRTTATFAKSCETRVE
ncbi:hypothetical protein Bxe_A0878 [Paraburkholderia xenovorans LB400]|uniref:Uncharacterized protein n=1 Tax=Paraburkholderia xenovorans (strain LB400) TaxID=266265 RepID=Q13V22_PARXL|nr:hypothetical protein Bxe_A0878 [Paraburkholderia xenovorans LB400]